MIFDGMLGMKWRWWFRHPGEWFATLWSEVVALWQYARRGYSWKEQCNIGPAVARYILPMLRIYRADHSGVPASLCFDPNGYELSLEDADARWNAILNEVIWALDAVVNESECDEGFDRQRYERGLELFGKWLPAMWD